MDSFYAGLPGTPFVLREKFNSVAEMTAKFTEQEEYRNVWFGEYCIIDTPDKHSLENGRIYKRGYTGAEYCGQIVGPNGLRVHNIRIIQAFENTDKDIFSSNRNPIYDINSYGKITDSDVEPNDLDYKNGVKPDSMGFKSLDANSIKTTLWENFNYAKYQYWVCDITDDAYRRGSLDKEPNYTKTWTCFIGFYNVLTDLVVDESGTVVTSWTSTKDRTQQNFIKWIDRISLDENTGIFEIDGNGNNPTLDMTKYLKWLKNVSINPQTGRVTYTYTNNNSKETATGDFKRYEQIDWIDDIDVDPSGKITYHHVFDENNPDVDEQQITWIDEISLNENTGVFKIDGNGDNHTLDMIKYLKWVKDVSIDEDGKVTYTYTNNGKNDPGSQPVTSESQLDWIKNLQIEDDGTIIYTHADKSVGKLGDIVEDKKLGWIDSISLDPETGIFIIDGNGENNRLDTHEFLKWVKDINIDPNTGKIVYTYTNDGKQEGIHTREASFDWIKDISIDEHGTVSYVHTDGSKSKTEIQKLGWIEDIELNSENGLFTVTGNGDNQKAYVQEYLKWIKDINIDPSTGIITYTYTNNGNTSEPYTRTASFDWIKNFEITDDGTAIYTHADGSKTKTEPQKFGWINSISLNNNGVLNIVGNNEKSSKQEYLKWVKDIDIDKDTGTIKYIYTNNGENGQEYITSETIDWVKDVELEDNGTFTRIYADNTTKDYNNKIKWIETIDLNEDTGLMTIKGNYDASENPNTLDRKFQFTWLKDIEIDDEGVITHHFTDSHKDDEDDHRLVWVKDSYVDEYGNLNIKFNYNDEKINDVNENVNAIIGAYFENGSKDKDEQYYKKNNLLKFHLYINFTYPIDGFTELRSINGIESNWADVGRISDGFPIGDAVEGYIVDWIQPLEQKVVTDNSADFIAYWE